VPADREAIVPASRVAASQGQDWTAGAEKTTWYSYDDLGNRISHQYRDAAAIGYEHDKANRMTKLADKTQQYDKAGNLTLAFSADRGTSYTYTYDHHNRLIEVEEQSSSTRKAALTYDALGRRIEVINDVPGTTTRYWYDGVNEIVETDENDTRQRYFVHGISYVDERLMMFNEDDDRPYYYAIDRMYNVRAVVDRAGARVERYAYDPYGRPLIRESAGRGDMNDDTDMDSGDMSRVNAAFAGTIWDPRGDLDDDGDVDATDRTLYVTKDNNWPPQSTSTTVAQAFSDVDNPFMFQGRPHFAFDTQSTDTAGKLMLNDHRARMNDPVTGRWTTRDPLGYNSSCVHRCPGTLGPHSSTAAFLRTRTPGPCATRRCGLNEPQTHTTYPMSVRPNSNLGFVYLGNQPVGSWDPLGLDHYTSPPNDCEGRKAECLDECDDIAPVCVGAGFAACDILCLRFLRNGIIAYRACRTCCKLAVLAICAQGHLDCHIHCIACAGACEATGEWPGDCPWDL